MAQRLPAGARAVGVGRLLYRSVLRAARFCDANHTLRRHVLTRLVREAIHLDGISSQVCTTWPPLALTRRR
jgi:hypothetical protein